MSISAHEITSIPDWMLDALFAKNQPIRTDAAIRIFLRELELFRLAEAEEAQNEVTDPVVRQYLPLLSQQVKAAKDETLGYFTRDVHTEAAETIVRKIIARQNSRQVLGLPASADECEIEHALNNIPDGAPQRQFEERVWALYDTPGRYTLHNALAARWNATRAPT